MIIRKEPFGYMYLNLENGFNIELLSNQVKKEFNVIDNSEGKQGLFFNQPLVLDIYFSFECNFNCNFCFNKLHSYPKSELMNKRTIEETIKYIIDKGIYIVNILGGEPLKKPQKDKVFYFIKKLREKNKKVVIDLTTNAYYINKEVILFLKRYDVKLNISLLSIKEKSFQKITNHNNVKKIKRNILNFVDNKIQYGVSTPIIKTNYNDFNDIIKFTNSLNFKSWVLRYPTYKKNNNFNFKLVDFFKKSRKVKEKSNKEIKFDAPFSYKFFYEDIEETISNKIDKLLTRCSGGNYKIQILPNGDIHRCILLIDKKKKIGNIFDEDFSLNKPNFINKKCDCKLKKYCKVCEGYLIINKLEYDDRCKNEI